MSGTGTFSTGTGTVSLNGDTTIAANKNVSLADGTGTIHPTFSPNGTTATATGATFTPKFGIDVTDQTLTGVLVNPNTNSNTDAGDTLYGINIDTITGTAANEVGLRIGTGYDTGISVAFRRHCCLCRWY